MMSLIYLLRRTLFSPFWHIISRFFRGFIRLLLLAFDGRAKQSLEGDVEQRTPSPHNVRIEPGFFFFPFATFLAIHL